MRVTPNCDSINSFYINNYTGVQMWPDIVYGANQYMVVWTDTRSGYNRIYGARVTPSGTVLEPNGILIGPGTATYQYYPSVGYNGLRYFVVWGYSSSPYGVTGRFVNTDGTLGDTVRIASSNGVVYGTDIAYDGSNFMVAWVEYSTISLSYSVKARRVSGSTGAPIGSIISVADTVYYYNSLGLSWDGYNYLVTYCKAVGGIYQIMGRFYGASGEPAGSAFNISNTSYICYYNNHIPGANGRYLNLWSEYRGNGYDIYANLDVLIGIEENSSETVKPHVLKSSIVTDFIELADRDAMDTKIDIYDITGRLIGSTPNGRFDCSSLKSGIYFVATERGERFKVIKLK